MRNEPLPAWQWRLYGAAHNDRTNLAIHLATQPLFVAGALALVAAPFAGRVGLALAGLAAMALAVALQGRGHRRERTAPAPFAGPAELVARLLVEQFVTFPRYVLSGGFARAWRAAGPGQAAGAA